MPYGGWDIAHADAQLLGLADTEAAAVGGVITPAAKTIAASGTAFSRELDVASRVNDPLGVYVVITGSGTAKVEVLGSPLKDDSAAPYVLVPDGELVTNQGSTTGKWFRISLLVPTPFIKFKVTEDGGADPVTVSLYYAVR